MTTLTFEISDEDVQNVLRSNIFAVADTQGKSFAQMASELLPQLDLDLIDKSAMMGDSPEQQTDFACDEITRQLSEIGVLEAHKISGKFVSNALTLPTNKIPRPDFQALDSHGLEYTRPATIIAELPTSDERLRASKEAAITLAVKLCLPAPDRIKTGVPVHSSFEMTRQQAKNHPQSKLLLTPGDQVSLDYCPTYLNGC